MRHISNLTASVVLSAGLMLPNWVAAIASNNDASDSASFHETYKTISELINNNRPQDAEVLCGLFIRTHGADIPLQLMIPMLDLLASALLNDHKYAKAESILRKNIEFAKECGLAPDNFWYVKTTRALTRACSSQAKYKEAEQIIRELIRQRQKTIQPDETGISQDKLVLAILCVKNGKHTEAEELLNSSVSYFKDKRSQKKDLLDSLYTYAIFLEDSHRATEAELYFQWIVALEAMGDNKPHRHKKKIFTPSCD